MAKRTETLRGVLRNGQALVIFACCNVLCGFVAEAIPVVSENDVMPSLSESGYPPPADPGSEGIVFEEVMSAVNSKLQSFTKINFTGIVLDTKTAELMTLPESFLEAPKTGSRMKRYVLAGSKWHKKDLTYRINKYASQLDRADVDETIARAFAMWSNYTDLKFSTGTGEVDIEISFEGGEHGDLNPFERNSDAHLAHAFHPSAGGDIHFNDEKNWTINSHDGYNLLSMAVYMTGYSLGLGHSNVTSSAMGIYSSYNPNFELASDDIEGIQALYGPKTVKNVPQFCGDPQVDTIFDSAEGHRYVFKGEHYWMLTDDRIAFGYPKLIATTWSGLPDNIDVAFTNKLGETYFFKGMNYWKYQGHRRDPGWPRKNDIIRTSVEMSLWNTFIRDHRRTSSILMSVKCFSDSFTSIFQSSGTN